MSERLDRIEASLETLVRAIETDRQQAVEERRRAEADRQHATEERAALQVRLDADRQQAVEERRRAEAERLELRTALEFLIQAFEQHQQNFERHQQDLQVAVAQITGMQTEIRRILDYLFGQQQNGRGGPA